MYASMDEWLNEVENFATRSERLHEEFGSYTPHVLTWLETAWRLGGEAEIAELIELARLRTEQRDRAEAEVRELRAALRPNLYLDTEFDGHGGPLVSLALAGDDGSRWYGVFEDACNDDWVNLHVAPLLYAMKPTIQGNHDVLRFSLNEYISARSGCTIWADWPADFEYLMHLMCGPDYSSSFMVPCTLKLINTPDGEPKPEHPHNALSDALALMQWHQCSGPR